MTLKTTCTLTIGFLWAIANAQVDFRPEKTSAQIARDSFPSVVLLTMQDEKGQVLKLGSGFFVAANTVVTNFHVIDGTAGGYAKIVGQPAKLLIEGLLGVDPVHDLALLQLSNSQAPALRVDSLAVDDR